MRRLNAYHLAHRSNQRRITEVFTNVGNFCQNFFQSVQCVKLFKLAEQVGQHTAGHFVSKSVCVGGQGTGHQHSVGDILIADRFKVVVHFFKYRHIDVYHVAELLQQICKSLGCGLTRTAAETTACRVDNVRACLDTFQISGVRKSRRAVRMKNNRQTNFFLEGFGNIVSLLRSHYARHILNADGGGSHFFHFFRHAYEVLQRMNGTGGVTDCAACDSAAFYGFLYRDLYVTRIVKRVEDTDDIDTVFYALLNKLSHDVVRIVFVTQHVLTAEQHLQFRVGHRRAYFTQSFPGVFFQKPETSVEGRAAPTLYGIISRLVHSRQNLFKFVKRKTGSNQRLVGVSQDGFGKSNFFHFVPLVDILLFFCGFCFGFSFLPVYFSK